MFLSPGRCLPPLEFELLPAASSPSGRARLLFKPSPLQYHAYTNTKPTPDNSSRLHEILSRLGEICLSPELAHSILFPAHALAYQASLSTKFDFPHATVCNDAPSVLAHMADLPASTSQAVSFLTKFSESCLPKPKITILKQPIHLCAWRLESPSRACLFVGQHPQDTSTIDPGNLTPHTLSKVLLDERSKRPMPSSIHLITDDISPNAIRKSLLHYAQTALTPHQERVSTSFALDTTLEEAFVCLIHAPARNHTQIELNQSPPW